MKLTSLLVLLLLATSVAADDLFQHEETLIFSLASDFAGMRKARDKSLLYPATLTHANKNYEIEVSVRGNRRLDPDTCKHPPLWLDFDKSVSKQTYFAHQKHTKLVVLCNGRKNFYKDYLRAEYLVYKLYERLVAAAFRVRWAEATYVDGNKTRTEPAFFIERKARLAKRLNMKSADVERIKYSELDTESATMAGLFNYVIANADFSVVTGMEGSCCHNSKLFETESGSYVPVLYDFDSSGIINTEYARPPTHLGAEKVTQRLYRGHCRHNENLPAARAAVLSAEDDLHGIIENDPILSDRYKKKMRRFLTGSLEIVQSDKKYQRSILNKCRG